MLRLSTRVYGYIARQLLLPMRALIVIGIWALSANSVAQNISNESIQKINSFYDELNPVLAPDGLTLYYTIANHPANVGGKRDPGDIWYVQWLGDKWSEPVHAGAIINDRAFNAVGSVSADGNTLLLLSHYDISGNTPRTQGISLSHLQHGEWSRPHNINIPYFQNKSTFLSGSFSRDLTIFVFSAETYGTHGVDDIYVSVLENGKWSEPRNVGDGINTQFQELSPSLSADTRTMYFSTNGRSGSGSFDVYESTRLDDTWTAWSEPVNLGSPVNTEGRELFFRDYGEQGFSILTSTKNSDGYGDIRIHRDDDPVIAVADTVFASTDNAPDTTKSAKEDPTNPPKPAVLKVYGKVTDSRNGESVDAILSFSAASAAADATSSGENGYVVELPSGSDYTIRIEAPGYISALEKLDMRPYGMSDLEMNFTLQPVQVGTTVNLKNVLFVQTRPELLPESYDELDLVVSFMKKNPNVKIELSGHTDNRGIHADNMRLSQQRVNVVKQYLVSKGIDSKRIYGKGYGGTRPVASNDTEETRKMNRRVEFTIRKF